MAESESAVPVHYSTAVAKHVVKLKGQLKDLEVLRCAGGDSLEVVRRSVHVIRDIASRSKWATAAELIDLLTYTGMELQMGLPSDALVTNMVRRVLRLVREAYTECLNESKGLESETNMSASVRDMMLLPEEVDSLYTINFKDLKTNLMLMINDLIEELDESSHNIADGSIDHIHEGEIIMTTGGSIVVEDFLKKAAAKRRFHVMVAESAPSFEGQRLAVELGKAGIDTTLITDSAVFAVMSRVNKVIIGTHTVMADGGLMALSGAHALALAAKHHSVPVVVCAAIFQLCPKYICSYDHDDSNHMLNPASIVDYADTDVTSASVTVVCPMFDHVPASLVNLFISNEGSHPPSYIYRMLSDYYHADDIE